MKILITGATGQLGLELQKQLLERKIKYIALSKSQLDISNFNDVNDIMIMQRPNVVINCAAYTKVDDCEKNEINAFKVNAIGTQNMAIATNKISSKIVHVSTDYVFDGDTNIPYREYDMKNPQSVYGKSKSMGEDFIEVLNPKHFIVRTSWLYGEGNNFVKAILDMALKKDELNIVDDQIGTPTSTVDLARTIINLIQTEKYGIYHGTCEGSCSWYDFARKIFELKKFHRKINRISTEQLNKLAPRPRYSVLDNFMLKLIGLNTFRSWENSIEEYLRDEDLKI
jgi:dTDP-4-dehydrorhamnose reductase